jgi:hypothetical protein
MLQRRERDEPRVRRTERGRVLAHRLLKLLLLLAPVLEPHLYGARLHAQPLGELDAQELERHGILLEDLLEYGHLAP